MTLDRERETYVSSARANSDRRGFLRGLATLPLVGGGAAIAGLRAAGAPALVPPEGELGARAVAAYHRCDRLIVARCDIEEEIYEALRPFRDAIEVRENDPWSFNRPNHDEYDGRRRYKLAHLSILQRVTNLPPEHEQRRKDIIAALERYRDEDARLRSALGLQEAKLAEEEALETNERLFDEVVQTRAATLADIIAKAKAVKAFYADEEPGDDEGSTDVRIAMSIVRDLLALDSGA